MWLSVLPSYVIHKCPMFPWLPQITEAYITSRLESVKTILRYLIGCIFHSLWTSLCYHRDQLDNPLDDDAMIGTQLDQISTIARLVYGKTCSLLIQLFDEVAGRYQDQIQQTTDAWQLIEGNWALVWMKCRNCMSMISCLLSPWVPPLLTDQLVVSRP